MRSNISTIVKNRRVHLGHSFKTRRELFKYICLLCVFGLLTNLPYIYSCHKFII